MLVVLLCVLVVVGSMVVLALAGLHMWRVTVSLGRAVGGAGEAVAQASVGLEQSLGELQAVRPADPPARPGSPASRSLDGDVLAARVAHGRGRRR